MNQTAPANIGLFRIPESSSSGKSATKNSASFATTVRQQAGPSPAASPHSEKPLPGSPAASEDLGVLRPAPLNGLAGCFGLFRPKKGSEKSPSEADEEQRSGAMEGERYQHVRLVTRFAQWICVTELLKACCGISKRSLAAHTLLTLC